MSISSKHYFYFALCFITAFKITYNDFNLITGDETWAATSILGNPFENLVFILRFDLHPPLYYILLDLWSLISFHDIWLKASSAVTHAATVASTFYITQRIYGTRTANIASLFTLLSPELLFYAFELRMYSLISLLSIWIFYFAYHTNEKKLYFKLFIIELCLVFTHAIGIIFIFIHFLFGLQRRLQLNCKKTTRSWVQLHFLVFIISIPVIINSMARSAQHALTPTGIEIFDLLHNSIFILPYEKSIISILILASIFFGLLLHKKTQKLLIFYLIIPVVIFIAITFAIKSIWLPRNFVFIIPIISILTAIGINSLIETHKKHLGYTCILVISFFAISHNLMHKRNQQESEDLSIVSKFISNQKQINTCIIAPEMQTFWALLRYNFKNNWGNPLEIQPALSDKWFNILQKIPQPILNTTKLKPQQHFKTYGNLTISTNNKNCPKQAEQQLIILEDITKQDKHTQSSILIQLNKYSVLKKVEKK